MAEEEYYDGYMEEEEEWDREGLLDPAWEKQQKKVSVEEVLLRVWRFKPVMPNRVGYVMTFIFLCSFGYYNTGRVF